MALPEIDTVLSTVADGRTRDLRYRQRQFISLHQWITSHVTAIENALRREYNLSESEAQFTIALSLRELREYYNSLDLKSFLANEYSVRNGRNSPTASVPEALVYILPENFSLFYSVICALCACIAAGSCCIVELPHELTDVSSLVRRCLVESLDRTAFVATQTRPPSDILARCLIVDQTSGLLKSVGKRMLTSRPESWAVAIVDRTADLENAAKEISYSRTFFSGRSPYSPSFILINEFVEENFLRLLRKYSTGKEGQSSMNSVTINGVQPQKALFKINGSRFIKLYKRGDLNVDCSKETDAVYLLATTSHDDAIDSLYNINNQDPLLALYGFAEPSAAKYLCQFVHSRVSFVNHIPANLLVGPAAPIEYPVSPTARYHREMIENPSPKFVTMIPGESSLQEIASVGSKLGQTLYNTSLQPLPAMGQPKEGDGNFFVHGMLTGFVFLVLPLLTGTVVGTSYAVLKLYRHWK